mmetsp:Transcript_24567/g.81700  ORF Transcript_24567/g.81700 Transcript_24567/m.81700 type:complete len:262 (+) Transcript_24567:624-1409(+)
MPRSRGGRSWVDWASTRGPARSGTHGPPSRRSGAGWASQSRRTAVAPGTLVGSGRRSARRHLRRASRCPTRPGTRGRRAICQSRPRQSRAKCASSRAGASSPHAARASAAAPPPSASASAAPRPPPKPALTARGRRAKQAPRAHRRLQPILRGSQRARRRHSGHRASVRRGTPTSRPGSALPHPAQRRQQHGGPHAASLSSSWRPAVAHVATESRRPAGQPGGMRAARATRTRTRAARRAPRRAGGPSLPSYPRGPPPCRP